MKVLDDVRALITRLSPSPICDDCVAEKLTLSVRQHANHKTRELAGTNGFERRRAMCSICYGEKLVTRRNRRWVAEGPIERPFDHRRRRRRAPTHCPRGGRHGP